MRKYMRRSYVCGSYQYMIVYANAWMFNFVMINYLYLHTIVPNHSSPRKHQVLAQSGETMLDKYDHTGKTIVLPNQGFHKSRLWQIQGASMSKQPQMLPMYAMLQLRIKSCSESRESKHQKLPNLHLKLFQKSFFYLIPPSLLLPVCCQRASFSLLYC